MAMIRKRYLNIKGTVKNILESLPQKKELNIQVKIFLQ